jgi:hypothetical protein
MSKELPVDVEVTIVTTPPEKGLAMADAAIKDPATRILAARF